MGLAAAFHFAMGTVITWEKDGADRAPLQVWPIPMIIGAYFAPESPWNAIRRNKPDLARHALRKLRKSSPTVEEEIEAQIALIEHTTRLEEAETAGASYLECFKGINLRRTEIVSRCTVRS